MTAEESAVLKRVEQALQAGEQSAATVSKLIDRIEARAYERGKADAKAEHEAGEHTAGQAGDAPTAPLAASQHG